MLGNKKCTIVYGDPVVLLQQRIKELKNQKRETNKI